MTQAPDAPLRKRLSHAEGVRAACILFELNTRESDILEGSRPGPSLPTVKADRRTEPSCLRSGAASCTRP